MTSPVHELGRGFSDKNLHFSVIIVLDCSEMFLIKQAIITNNFHATLLFFQSRYWKLISSKSHCL